MKQGDQVEAKCYGEGVGPEEKTKMFGGMYVFLKIFYLNLIAKKRRGLSEIKFSGMERLKKLLVTTPGHFKWNGL